LGTKTTKEVNTSEIRKYVDAPRSLISRYVDEVLKQGPVDI
jgi:hypothetical protein